MYLLHICEVQVSVTLIVHFGNIVTSDLHQQHRLFQVTPYKDPTYGYAGIRKTYNDSLSKIQETSLIDISLLDITKGYVLMRLILQCMDHTLFIIFRTFKQYRSNKVIIIFNCC